LGKGPSNDVLTALDKTVDEGWADKSKLLITGGSYAGYLPLDYYMIIV
jgi:dipeptidyl aminopeptidase/acylaminoacyl peptidase